MLEGQSFRSAWTDEELIAALGADFLAYVCAAEPAEFAGPPDRQRLPEPKRAVLDLTIVAAREFAHAHGRDRPDQEDAAGAAVHAAPVSWLFAPFCDLTTDGITRADELRSAAGGSVRTLPPDDDLVRRALMWLARDAWPALLLPVDQLTRTWAVPIAVAIQHPFGALLLDGVKQEREPLRRLFGAVEDPIASPVAIRNSAGRSNGYPLVFAGANLIGSAALRTGWPSRRDIDEFFAEVEVALSELRRLARRRTVPVPARVSLTGITFEEPGLIGTDLGDLKPAPTQDPRLPEWPTGHLVLTTTFPLRYSLIESDETSAGSDDVASAWHEFETAIDLVRLSILLATWPEVPYAVRVVSTEILDPLFAGHRQATLAPTLAPMNLPPGSETEIQSWSERVARHFDRRIALAIRRLLSATDQLRAADDVLVDAVIALEALFGTGKTEVGFRLQLAVSALLADGVEERRRIFAEVGELYEARSALVHGSSIPGTQVIALGQRAIELGVRCLRLLFTDHQALIPRDGRGKDIILGMTGS